MDYPKAKLDVKLLIEEKDEETLAEAENLGFSESPSRWWKAYLRRNIGSSSSV